MKNALVIGGTRFFGRKLVEQLIQAQYDVTILTRGNSEQPFGNKVRHIICDRLDEKALQQALGNEYYDVVFDNICYSPNEAKQLCNVLQGNVGKLVFTSTLSVAEADGKEKKEEDFNPYNYAIRYGNKEDFTYGEGKRQAEAVFFQQATFPVVAVRFPIVMGTDDYTRRLHFHIEHVVKQQPMGFVNMEAEMSYILADEAAAFLKWISETSFEGPIHATANGKISLKQLVAIIEEETEKRAKIVLIGPEEIRSPYAVPFSWYMNNSKATELGFKFSNLEDWLQPLIQQIIKLENLS